MTICITPHKKLSKFLILLFLIIVSTSNAYAFGEREVKELDYAWKFSRSEVSKAFENNFDDSKWEQVKTPHSFNSEGDGADGSKYYQGVAWYRTDFKITNKQYQEKQVFIEFDGALLTAEAWLNGQKIGTHEGGYARFRFDITSFIKPGNNVLAVKIDNRRKKNIAPLSGDFTQFGGIYRPVRLIFTKKIHFDMLDYGSSGVYLTQTKISKDIAEFDTKIRINNKTNIRRDVIVKLKITDASGKAVLNSQKTVSLNANSINIVELNDKLLNPHLWQGIIDPYLYTANVSIESNKQTIHDKLSFKIGFRNINIEPDKGLILNGKPYQVYGPNIHLSMRPNKTVAVSHSDIEEDFQIWREMGATGLRLSHYQHDPYTYELADKYGFLVWTEAPIVSEIKGTDSFISNSSIQLKELIRQNYNHSSVFVWGLGNEIYNANEDAAKVLKSMQTLAREEDSMRPTVYANCCIPIDHPQAKHTDLIASNVYLGWYNGEFSDLGPWLDNNRKLRPNTPLGISEYGAGGSIMHQEDPPRRPKTTDIWHPEQYQTLYHEAALKQLNERDWLWAKFIWVGFDFPSVWRNEGDRKGFNDKGLVTYDRKTRKDAYYWYQANWTQKPMVYITSRRFNIRYNQDIELKIYTNEPEVTLSLNGTIIETQKANNHIAIFKIKLALGRNQIAVKTKNAFDSIDWIMVEPQK